MRLLTITLLALSLISSSLPLEGAAFDITIGECMNECCAYGKWQVKSPMPLYAAPQKGAHVIRTLRPGERVEAITGVILTLRPGYALVKSDLPFRVNNSARDILNAAPGDTIYILHYVAEGIWKVRFKNRKYEIELPDPTDDDSDGTRELPAEDDNYIVKSRPTVVWWVTLRLPDGTIGYAIERGGFMRPGCD